MINSIYILVILAAVFFILGATVHFLRHHEATVWWRGSMGLLAFANTLLLLEILGILRSQR